MVQCLIRDQLFLTGSKKMSGVDKASYTVRTEIICWLPEPGGESLLQVEDVVSSSAD
jgi:hypothetical protein